MFVLYKFRKNRIKGSIIKRVKVKKCRKYGLFPISRQVRKCEKFNSIPVRVTIQQSRKQRNIAVSEFFIFLKIALGTYLGLMLSSRTVACLDADYLRTVDVTFITNVCRDSRLRIFRRCRFGIVKAQSICNCVAGLDLILSEHMRIQVQSSQP